MGWRGRNKSENLIQISFYFSTNIICNFQLTKAYMSMQELNKSIEVEENLKNTP